MPQLDITTYRTQVTSILFFMIMLYIFMTWSLLPNSVVVIKIRKKVIDKTKFIVRDNVSTNSIYLKMISRIVRI